MRLIKIQTEHMNFMREMAKKPSVAASISYPDHPHVPTREEYNFVLEQEMWKMHRKADKNGYYWRYYRAIAINLMGKDMMDIRREYERGEMSRKDSPCPGFEPIEFGENIKRYMDQLRVEVEESLVRELEAVATKQDQTH